MIPNPLYLADEGEVLQAAGFEIVLERRRVGVLQVPTGKIVVCDPLTTPETEPFAFDVPHGNFDVHAVVANMREETRIAYVVVSVAPQRAERWEIAHLANEDAASWGGERLGAPIESNFIAMMDDQTAGELLHHNPDPDEFETLLRRSMRRNRANPRIHVADIPFERGNMLAFDADVGTYVTYVGFDEDNAVTMVVLDFEVLDYRFTPYGPRY